jgi:SAM-dependent methyltransferase
MSDTDEHLPSGIDAINLVMNRARLAAFLARFAEDKDMRDLLALDVLGSASGLPLSSTGISETRPGLILRPFRIWEYLWLYKSLGLSAGGIDLLELGGPASHLSILAAMAGCQVTSIDINPEFVRAAEECARALKLDSLHARHGDMRDLKEISEGSFEVVLCCSVLEHLTVRDQEIALAEMARVLRPGGLIGLTFDYGPPAPGANEHLPPPHEPLPTAGEVSRRFVRNGLSLIGNAFTEEPIPGSLFHHDTVKYTIASLFLGKAPVRDIGIPQCELTGSVLNRLVIEQLPHRIHQTLTRSNAVIDNLRARMEEEMQRAAMLEACAAERLKAMLEKEELIFRLDAELQPNQKHISELHAELQRNQNHISELQAEFERAAAFRQRFVEAETQCHQVTAERDRLQRETSSLLERIRGFEEETWREYLSRRWAKRRRPTGG